MVTASIGFGVPTGKSIAFPVNTVSNFYPSSFFIVGSVLRRRTVSAIGVVGYIVDGYEVSSVGGGYIYVTGLARYELGIGSYYVACFIGPVFKAVSRVRCCG